MCMWTYNGYLVFSDSTIFLMGQFQNDRVPWCKILMSMPVWALNVCNFGRSFVFFLLLTNEPAYLNVFGFTLAEVG